MKRFLAFLLAFSLIFSLTACGGTDTPDETTAAPAPVLVEESADAVSLPLGTTADTGFAKFSFSSALVHYKVGGSKGHRIAPDGMQYFCLLGTVRNTAGSELNISQLKGEMTFGGKYTYSVQGGVSYSEGYESSLPALMEGTFLIYAEVPDALLEQLTDCTVTFSFSDHFGQIPENADTGEYRYCVYLDESVCAAALEGPAREAVYFEECPILPTPMSFSDMYQTSRSSSSSNGKVTSLSYSFSLNWGAREDIHTAYGQYVTGLRNSGFTVQTGDNGDEVFSGSVLLARMQIQNGNMIHLDILPGNETLTAPAAGTAPAPGADTDVEIPFGSPIENDYVYLHLNKTGTASEIRSGTGNYGYYHFYTSDNGDPYFYLEGTFKNLGGTPVNIWNVYITFTFDDKYTYKGDMDGFVQGKDDFVHHISPLSTVGCYVYAPVPREILSSYSTCVVRIGFTEDFNYKTVDMHNLPKFDVCDDVYTITLSR